MRAENDGLLSLPLSSKGGEGNGVTAASERSGYASACAGFTLIEIVGVLAILAILALVVFSVTTRSLDFAAANLESTSLANYATAFQNNILRNRYIPGASDWATVIAAELGVNVSSVTNNGHNITNRFFLIDPALQIGTNAAGMLPYVQSNLVLYVAANSQAYQPNSPRVMIVSSLSTPLPDFVTSGTASSAVFNNLWNWPNQSAAPPAGWPANWNNRGTDLVVQRINLAPLFVHLTLQDYPPSSSYTNSGQYAIDRLATNQVPPTTAWVPTS